MFELQNLVRDNVKNIKPYSSARDEYKEVTNGMVFMDANENPFETGLNRYPDPQQTDIKEILAKQNGLTREHILLGNGSDEVLDLIFRAFCEPNRDEIITLPPTYGMYNVLAELNAIKNNEILLKENFQPDVSNIINGFNSSTKILFICSPNNPTANTFDSSLIDKLLKKFNGIVVIDEAYIDFSKQESWLKLLRDYPNLIVTQTLSKAYGLAGIRLGICYASKEIITVLNKIKPPYNINQLTQQKAVEILSDTKRVKDEVNYIKDQREKLIQQLFKIGIIEKVYPTDANFILVKVDNANLRYQELINKGIVVRNRSSQPLCENCLRLTVGTEKENKMIINALKELR